MRELTGSIEPAASVGTKKKRRNQKELGEIVEVALEVLEQYMEHDAQHLRNHLMSESEKTLKYPDFEFLLQQFQEAESPISTKVYSIGLRSGVS